MRVLHLAAYNKNIGDSIAVEHIRKEFPGLEWIDLDIECENSYDTIKEQDYDLLMIGGGGLIEGAGWNRRPSGWKIPLTKDNLREIDKPIVVFAVGCNFFRGMEQLNELGLSSLKALIDRAELFSVRNDGSGRLLKEIYGQDLEIDIIPDPGVIWDKEVKRKERGEINKILFAPSINTNAHIMKHRGINNKEIHRLVKEIGAKTIGHTPKDFVPYFNHIVSLQELKDSNFSGAAFSAYDDFDLVIAMRGHAQLVAYGKNIPCITLSTQNKISGFYKTVEMGHYLADTKEDGWRERLFKCINCIDDDLEVWYDLREKHIHKLKDDFNNFCDKVKKLIER